MKLILSTSVNQQLPVLTNIHITKWMPLITERAFTMWLKLMVLAQSKNAPKTIQALVTHFDSSQVEFEAEILAPLYEVGLIELDYPQIQNDLFQKITIHAFPFNDLDKVNSISKVRKYRKHIPKEVKPVLSIHDVLTKHHTKLWTDKIEKSLLINLLKEEQRTPNPLSEQEFTDLIDKTLTNSKSTIGSKGSVNGYFKTVIKRYKEKKISKGGR